MSKLGLNGAFPIISCLGIAFTLAIMAPPSIAAIVVARFQTTILPCVSRHACTFIFPPRALVDANPIVGAIAIALFDTTILTSPLGHT